MSKKFIKLRAISAKHYGPRKCYANNCNYLDHVLKWKIGLLHYLLCCYFSDTRYKLGKNFFVRTLQLHELWNGICHRLNRRFPPIFFFCWIAKNHTSKTQQKFSVALSKELIEPRSEKNGFCVHNSQLHSTFYISIEFRENIITLPKRHLEYSTAQYNLHKIRVT